MAPLIGRPMLSDPKFEPGRNPYAQNSIPNSAQRHRLGRPWPHGTFATRIATQAVSRRLDRVNGANSWPHHWTGCVASRLFSGCDSPTTTYRVLPHPEGCVLPT